MNQKPSKIRMLVVLGRKDRVTREIHHIPFDHKIKVTAVVEKAPSGKQFRGYRVQFRGDHGWHEQIVEESRIDVIRVAR